MRKSQGFSLVELLVVVIAVGILAGTVLERVLPLIGRAQHAAFMQTRADLETALLLEAAERITRGEAESLASLAGTNPMSLLLRPPGNYVGSFAADDDEAPAASWYFDEHARRLVYRVGRHTGFDPLGGPPGRIELATEFVFEDRNGNGHYDAAPDEFRGLRLTPQHAFTWPD